MPSAPLVNTGPPPSTRSVAALAGVYTATVSTDVLRSSLDARVPLSNAAREALRSDPGYAPWPTGAGLSGVDDTTLVLMRLKTVFDFSAGIAATDTAELEKAISATWPQLATLAHEVASGTAAATYEQCTVTAQLTVTGEPSWGYERNVNGGKTLPLPALTPDGTRPEFDRFIQNLVRLDLQRRIEQT